MPAASAVSACRSAAAAAAAAGQNLQDHMELYVQQFCTQPITLYSAQWKFPHNMVRIGLEWLARGTGKGATNHMEAGGFVSTPSAVARGDHANAQFHFFPGMLAEQSAWDERGHGFQLHVGTMYGARVLVPFLFHFVVLAYYYVQVD